MLEITSDDIALLSDEQLRALVGRLCETELCAHGYSAAFVTWGGDQNAADGGIDVRVALPPGSVTDGFVPRTATGFQVKKQDMPAAEITKEMRPNGTLRPVIQDLAGQKGAYIIVSSKGSTADFVLRNRRRVMAEAVADTPNADALALDFYDRNRLATWVHTHEALIPWVRELAGKPIPGWQSYGTWVAPLDDEFLVDDRLRIHPGKKETETRLSARDGIQKMREELRAPRRVVRLVGLSGVGKTRLVQALFDERVGEQNLDPSLAIYTNLSDGPDPQPIGLASDLIASGARAILVIDNCPPDLHHRLSELCRRDESKLSILTVEYDLHDDEPEGTDVFILDSSSLELIETLVRRRFPNVSEIDARSIAESSGGNARVALALAGTVEDQGSVAGLTDQELFRRLFQQRQVPDASLYLIAQACALVYSLNGEDVSEDGELARLGRTIGKTTQEIYHAVAELKRRDLVQQRSVWRAVLPHAIANRLAAVALQNIPYAVIERHLLAGASERLLKSFSRRLSYLHTSTEAVGIVKQWIGPDGFLADVARLSEFGRALFENVAPVAPEDTLAAMERAFGGVRDNDGAHPGEPFLSLLRSLAYDAHLFERCVALMVRICAAGEVCERSHGTELFVSLFHLHLSGTHATVQQRSRVVSGLLASEDARRQALGVLALKALLEAEHFFSSDSFDFGARSRDFGFSPRRREDVRDWFCEVLAVVKAVACSDAPVAGEVRLALAEKFRGIWRRGGVPDELGDACRTMREAGFWPEGWLAVRQTLDFDGKEMPSSFRDDLKAIEVALRPADIEQKVRAVVFSTRGGADFEDYDEDGGTDLHARLARAEGLAQQLGRAVAQDEALLESLLPAIVTSDGRLWQFGVGLLEGASDPEAMWQRLKGALAGIEEQRRRPLALRGFLSGLQGRDASLAAKLLDDAVEDETLGPHYPSLQVAVPLQEQDVLRLRRSLASGKIPVREYVYLAFGRAAEPIAAPDLRDLVLSIAAVPEGYDVAVEILWMRLHSVAERKEEVPPELAEAGGVLLRQLCFTKSDREDYRVGEIAKQCLSGAEGVGVVEELCGKLKEAVSTFKTHAFYHDDLLHGLLVAQPTASLVGLCGGDAESLENGIRILDDVRSRKDVLGAVSDEELLAWCDKDPQARYPAIASVVTVAQRSNGNEPPRWTGRAMLLLRNAPNPGDVLREMVRQFTPAGGWSGSLAAILEAHQPLLDELSMFPNLTEPIADEKAKLRQEIDRQRKSETARDRQRNERFE